MLVQVREAFHEMHICFALVISTFCKLIIELRELIVHLRDVLEGTLCFLAYSTFIGEHHHLRKVSNRSVARHADRSACWLLNACDYFEHCALACAILAYEGYAVVVVDDITDVIEERLCAEFYA